MGARRKLLGCWEGDAVTFTCASCAVLVVTDCVNSIWSDKQASKDWSLGIGWILYNLSECKEQRRFLSGRTGSQRLSGWREPGSTLAGEATEGLKTLPHQRDDCLSREWCRETRDMGHHLKESLSFFFLFFSFYEWH